MEQKIKTHKLPPRIKKFIRGIHNIIGEDRFILYGSSPIDLLLNTNIKIHDLDIAIEGINKYRVRKCREKIKREGFEILEPFRKYYIHKNKKVILIYAKNNRWFLDIAFLNNLSLIGHFNIETLFFRYPQNDYIDKFDALKGIKEKKIIPIRNLNAENPYLLLSRFLRLCSKYNISLTRHNHKKILLFLKTKIQQWKITSSFHKSVYISCLSSLLKSIIQSRNKKIFFQNLSDTSVFKIIFPELNRILNIHKNKIIKEVQKVETKLDIIVLFDKYLTPLERRSFKSKIRKLKMRGWDEDDVKCSNYFN